METQFRIDQLILLPHGLRRFIVLRVQRYRRLPSFTGLNQYSPAPVMLLPSRPSQLVFGCCLSMAIDDPYQVQHSLNHTSYQQVIPHLNY